MVAIIILLAPYGHCSCYSNNKNDDDDDDDGFEMQWHNEGKAGVQTTLGMHSKWSDITTGKNNDKK